MSNKDKNMEVLRLTFVICVLFILIVAVFTFSSFKDGFFREWTTMIIGLIGSVFGGFLTVYGVILTLNRTLDMTIEAEKKEIKKKDDEKKEMVNGIKFIIYSELKEYFNSIDKEMVNIIKTYQWHQFNLPNYKNVNGLYKLDKDFKMYIHKLISVGDLKNGKLLLEFYDKYLTVTNALSASENDQHSILYIMIKFIAEPDDYAKIASYTLYEVREAPGTILQFLTNPANHKAELNKFLEEHKKGKYNNLNFLNNEFKLLMEYLNEGM